MNKLIDSIAFGLGWWTALCACPGNGCYLYNRGARGQNAHLLREYFSANSVSRKRRTEIAEKIKSGIQSAKEVA